MGADTVQMEHAALPAIVDEAPIAAAKGHPVVRFRAGMKIGAAAGNFEKGTSATAGTLIAVADFRSDLRLRFMVAAITGPAITDTRTPAATTTNGVTGTPTRPATQTRTRTVTKII